MLLQLDLYSGKVQGNVMGAMLPKAVGRKVEQADWELPGLSIRGLGLLDQFSGFFVVEN